MATQDLQFHLPPECGGQIVEYSYALTEDGNVLCQRHDRSDGETSYSISRARVADEGDYQNGRPTNKRWRPCTAVELRRYGLDNSVR